MQLVDSDVAVDAQVSMFAFVASVRVVADIADTRLAPLIVAVVSSSAQPLVLVARN